jgi:dTDP-4-dehydrorhamnose 3,5-epimerase-like enzyme
MEGFAVTPLDEELGIPWPIDVRADDSTMVSRKDAAAPTWAQVRERLLTVP